MPLVASLTLGAKPRSATPTSPTGRQRRRGATRCNRRQAQADRPGAQRPRHEPIAVPRRQPRPPATTSRRARSAACLAARQRPRHRHPRPRHCQTDDRPDSRRYAAAGFARLVAVGELLPAEARATPTCDASCSPSSSSPTVEARRRPWSPPASKPSAEHEPPRPVATLADCPTPTHGSLDARPRRVRRHRPRGVEPASYSPDRAVGVTLSSVPQPSSTPATRAAQTRRGGHLRRSTASPPSSNESLVAFRPRPPSAIVETAARASADAARRQLALTRPAAAARGPRRHPARRAPHGLAGSPARSRSPHQDGLRRDANQVATEQLPALVERPAGPHAAGLRPTIDPDRAHAAATSSATWPRRSPTMQHAG